MLSHPRFEMIIDGRDSAGKNTCPTGLLQLFLEDIVAPICLGNISLQRIIILLRVIVPTQVSYCPRASEVEMAHT